MSLLAVAISCFEVDGCDAGATAYAFIKACPWPKGWGGICERSLGD
jgi:hypothetical protein